ncbi:hypothetical protein TI05_18110 [Achromatium sp. WMS3]|nr:hypothetical protein TI05_18110 [Achromatium sp. WMS3]
MNDFSNSLQKNDVALVYYSGHGVALSCNPNSMVKQNYLLPVGRRIHGKADVCDASLARPTSTQWILQAISLRGGGTNILLFDACRNELAEAKGFEDNGFAAMQGQGSFIGYATGPGKFAHGNKAGRYSIFTGHLLDSLRSLADVEIPVLFQQVRNKVAQDTGAMQVPWDNNSIVGKFCFKEPCRDLLLKSFTA